MPDSIAAAPIAARRLGSDSRVQLAAVLLIGLALRSVFFVGFSLGDDPGYLGHVTQILDGGYPPLDPLNQYAYRPLLLYLLAASVWLFGFTDVGIVAPVLAASLATIAIVYAFVRRLLDPGAAVWCALLFACHPFNVVNSTTITNDVILSCLVFGAVTAFLIADAESTPRRMRRLFVCAAALLTCAFLVKMTIVPALCALGVYSVASLRTRAAVVWRGHVVFYAAFLAGLAGICCVYYLKTGDPMWQFRSELQYYEAYKPDWYLRGAIDYAQLMSEYPRSLFGLSGYGSFTYLDHGVLFWLFAPAVVWVAVTRNRVLSFLVLLTALVFLFFEFYPQYLTPRYLPLVRQTRYLEQLLPAAVIVVGTALYRFGRRQRVLGGLVAIALLGDAVFETSRRSFLFNDSQQDMRVLAEYVVGTLRSTGKALAVDRPATASLQFHARGSPTPLVPAEGQLSPDSYVAVGGARSFWWSRDLVFDIGVEDLPAHWVLAYEVPGRTAPWRASNLRVYYIGVPHNARPLMPPVAPDSAGCRREGLREVRYAAGFDSAPVSLTDVARIPDIDNGTPAAPRMEWTATFRADDEFYTFETTSDDGSWIYVNDALVLDNGGTHPARTARKTIRLGPGWYRFTLRYENTGGDQFLRFGIHPGIRARTPSAPPAPPGFCVDLPGVQPAAGAAPGRSRGM